MLAVVNPKELNLAVRFLLELATLVALGFWGFSTSSGTFQRYALGLGVPVLAATLWGIFVSPRAQVQLPYTLRIGAGLLIMGSGVLALAATGRVRLALVFGLVVLVSTGLTLLWRQ